MPWISSGPGTGRYIIRSTDASQLAQLIDSIQSNPRMALLEAIGPHGQPHTLVVMMAHEMAAMLEQRFRESNHITIEPDRPLSLFGDA